MRELADILLTISALTLPWLAMTLPYIALHPVLKIARHSSAVTKFYLTDIVWLIVMLQLAMAPNWVLRATETESPRQHGT